MSPEAHSTDLYTVGKGIIKFDRFDANGLPTGLRDLGNGPLFNLVPTEEILEHYSSREGVKTLDKEIALSRKLNGRFQLDEYDKNNLRLALFGATGSYAIYPLSAGAIEGQLDMLMTNDVGAKFHVQIWKAKIRPTSEVNFISESWGAIDFEFTCQKDLTKEAGQEYGAITPIGES